jgi:hypothetical protein
VKRDVAWRDLIELSVRFARQGFDRAEAAMSVARQAAVGPGEEDAFGERDRPAGIRRAPARQCRAALDERRIERQPRCYDCATRRCLDVRTALERGVRLRS